MFLSIFPVVRLMAVEDELRGGAIPDIKPRILTDQVCACVYIFYHLYPPKQPCPKRVCIILTSYPEHHPKSVRRKRLQFPCTPTSPILSNHVYVLYDVFYLKRQNTILLSIHQQYYIFSYRYSVRALNPKVIITPELSSIILETSSVSHRQHHSTSSGLSLVNAQCGLDCDAGCVCVWVCVMFKAKWQKKQHVLSLKIHSNLLCSTSPKSERLNGRQSIKTK